MKITVELKLKEIKKDVPECEQCAFNLSKLKCPTGKDGLLLCNKKIKKIWVIDKIL